MSFLNKSITAACFLLGSTVMFGQNQDAGHWPVTLGFKGGVPVTNMFNAGSSGTQTSILAGSNLVQYFPGALANSTGGQTFTSSAPFYEFGPSAEFHLPFHLRFEVDGLYKRGGFDSTITAPNASGTAFTRTSFNQWEIPGMFKYNVTLGHYRPFIDFGASYRHISTIDESTALPGAQITHLDNSNYLRNRNSFGGVAGFGISFKKGPFEITPEARYTRWANNSFTGPGLTSNKNQGDVLIGISF